jgi:hypothetical protein
MILISMMGLRWASMVISFMEQGSIVEGEQIQSSSEKCSTPVDPFFSMASMIDVSVGGSRGKGGTVGLGEDSVKKISSWMDLDRSGHNLLYGAGFGFGFCMGLDNS